MDHNAPDKISEKLFLFYALTQLREYRRQISGIPRLTLGSHVIIIYKRNVYRRQVPRENVVLKRLDGSGRQPSRIRIPMLIGGDIGLGDVVRRVTSTLHIRHCGGCERRRAWLNRRFVFGPMDSMLAQGGHATEESKATRECPYCKETIKSDAIRCKHCGSSVSPEKPSHGGTCPYCREEIKSDAIVCKHCKSDLLAAEWRSDPTMIGVPGTAQRD